MKGIEKKMDDESTNDLKDILESQPLIDQVILNNSDDIALMLKIKQENKDAINDDQDDQNKKENERDKNILKSKTLCVSIIIVSTKLVQRRRRYFTLHDIQPKPLIEVG